MYNDVYYMFIYIYYANSYKSKSSALVANIIYMYYVGTTYLPNI